MQGLLGAWSLSGINLSWGAKLASLLVLPFAHEDLAIIAGAYIIVNDLMPMSLVALAIYGGMVASDFALYGIGAGARHLPWLDRLAIDDRIRRFGDTLKRNLFSVVLLCRVVPGVVFVAFIACGWARVSFARFTVASLIISAIYLPLMLYLVIVFGDALDDHVGLWTWPLLLGALLTTGFVRKRVFAFGDATEIVAPPPAADHAIAFSGMPALGALPRKVALAERIPPVLFYFPLVLSWIGLGLRYRSLTLPSACNPAIPTGGMWGESKSACLDQIGAEQRPSVANHLAFTREPSADIEDELTRALGALKHAGLTFPLIAKPDISWQGYGVRRLDKVDALRQYLRHFPAGQTLILQRFVNYAGEAAVLYARQPGDAQGGIVSLTLRYQPHVIGDGRSTLRDLIRIDPRARWKAHLHLGYDASHLGPADARLDRVPQRGEIVSIALIANQRAGGLYLDGRSHITPALVARFDAIARSMPEFHYGRFDVRFDAIESFARGEEFAIVEINGIGGEAIDAWDPHLSVGETYRRLYAQQRLLFSLGHRNRARGFAPTPAGEFLRLLVRQTRLIAKYPPSA